LIALGAAVLNYVVSQDGYLMPVKTGQPPPDLRKFNEAPE